MGVVAPDLEKVGLVQVGFVAQTDKTGKAEAIQGRPVQDAGAESAGLGHEGDGAAAGHGGGKAGVERAVGVDDAQAVGADDPHVVVSGDFDDLALHLAPLGAGFTKAGGDDDDGRDPFGGAVLNHGGDDLVGHDYDGEVDRPGNLGHAAKAGLAKDFILSRVDGVDLPLIAALDDIVEDAVSQLVGAGRSADYGDCPG
jgi:hypothetical protein